MIAILGDDQDLDDRVIRALWEENQELRDQVHHLKSNIGDTREEGRSFELFTSTFFLRKQYKPPFQEKKLFRSFLFTFDVFIKERLWFGLDPPPPSFIYTSYLKVLYSCLG